MVEHFPARPSRLNRNRQVVFDLLLPDELAKQLGPQTVFKRLLVRQRRPGNDSLFFLAFHVLKAVMSEE